VSTRLDLDEIAWVAGVLEARGHVEVTDRRGNPAPRLRVTTRKHELLVELARLTGNRVVKDERGYQKRPCGEHCRDQHVHVVRQSTQWTADSSRATIILAATMPYVRTRRVEFLRALEAGMRQWPATKGDTAKKMKALGWPMPQEEA
jgi:hypothetical protein